MSSQTTHYWQRKVTKMSPLVPPCLSVCLSICHSSTTEWISHWSVLLEVYLTFLIFGPKMNNIMCNLGYDPTRNNTWLWSERVVKYGRELGWGFKSIHLKDRNWNSITLRCVWGNMRKGRGQNLLRIFASHKLWYQGHQKLRQKRT